MREVAIITDSVAYLPRQVIDHYDIHTVPLSIIIEGKPRSEQSIDHRWFYEQLPKWKAENGLPTSSSISVGAFLEAYKSVSRRAREILYVSHSSKLGMSHNAALQAKEMARNELPETRIEVVDSLTACGAQMLVVLEAARAAEKGHSLDEVAQVARAMVSKVNFIVLHDDLYYLAKGGRIHKARPWSSSKVTNTVLLKCDHSSGGEHVPLARCRTKAETMQTLFDLVVQRSGDSELHVAVNHADAELEANELKEKASFSFKCTEILVSAVGPMVALHTGGGTRWFSWWS